MIKLLKTFIYFQLFKSFILRRSIGSYIVNSMNSHGHCNKLTDERVWLTALLSNSALALGVGCAEYAKQNKYDENKTHRICDN